MLPDIAHLISSDNSVLLHAVIFVSLILGGFGLPIPEDLPVLLAGIVAAKGAVPLTSIFAICYIGVIVADLMIYAIGYKLGPRLVSYGTKSPFLPSITAERVEKIRIKLNKHQFICIFLGRHLFPLRTVTFLSAGALRIPFSEFLLCDAIAAFISITIMIGLGYALGESITPETLKDLEGDLNFYAILTTLLLVSGYIFRKMRKRSKRRKEQEVTEYS